MSHVKRSLDITLNLMNIENVKDIKGKYQVCIKVSGMESSKMRGYILGGNNISELCTEAVNLLLTSEKDRFEKALDVSS